MLLCMLLGMDMGKGGQGPMGPPMQQGGPGGPPPMNQGPGGPNMMNNNIGPGPGPSGKGGPMGPPGIFLFHHSNRVEF